MGRWIDQLHAAGNLKSYWDLRKGSLLDQSGNANTLSLVNAPSWAESSRGGLIHCTHAGSNYLTPGNPASLQLSTMSLFVVSRRTEVTPANFSAKLSKLGAITLYDSTAPEPVLFGAWDWTGGAFRASTFRSSNDGILNMFGISFVSGLAGGLAFYGNGNPAGTATATIANQAGNWAIGSTPFAGEGLGGAVLLAGIVDRVLTSAEHSQLYTEWLQEGWIKNLARKNFVYAYPAKRASEYAAAGIVLDTDFKRRSDGKVRDLVGSYPGTLTGNPVPLADDDGGMVFDGVDDHVNFGDVLPINGAAALTIMVEVRSRTNGAGRSILGKILGGGNKIDLLCAATANPCKLDFAFSPGDFGETPTTVLRQEQKQVVGVTFNGGGVGNAGRLQMNVDADEQALAYTGTIPATTGAVAGQPFYFGVLNNWLNVEGKVLQVSTQPWTAAQRHAWYIKNFAQKLTLRETLEDVPVTLAASVAAPGQIGPWTLYGDSWACVESATGRRSMKHIGAGHGGASRPSSQAFGTWHFFMRTGTVSVQECYVFFIARLPGPYNVAGGQDGFMIYLNATQAYLFRLTGGGSTPIGNSAVGTITIDTEYEVIVNRRPSDCRFTVWMRGGGWGATWTQIIQVADPSHQTSQYITLGSVLRQDSFPMYDPRDPTCLLTAYQGCLDPVAGELPR